MAVVMGIIERLRAEYGHIQHGDWETWMERAGVVIKYRDFRDLPVVGAIRGDTIYLQQGMSKQDTRDAALHEFSHFATHDGDIRWWLTRPQGHITAAKFERQADTFARLVVGELD